MPNPVENELGLGPVMHRLRRWSRNKLARLGNGTIPEDKRMLDPLTVNYEAWREVRRTVREWPQYKEAANSVEILVSPEDWDDYWGIDTARKEAAVAAYVRMRAKDKGYWMAGDPQVSVYCEDAIEPGELEVNCQFAEPQNDDQSFDAVSSTAAHEKIEQVPEPRCIVTMGSCPQSGNVFRGSYAIAGPLSKYVHVDVDVAGCTPKPEAVIDGLALAAKILQEKRRAMN